MNKSIIEFHLFIFLVVSQLVPHLANWRADKKIRSYNIERQAEYAKEDRFNADPPEDKFREIVLQSRARVDYMEHEWIRVHSRVYCQSLWLRICSLYAGLMLIYLSFIPKVPPPYKRF